MCERDYNNVLGELTKKARTQKRKERQESAKRVDQRRADEKKQKITKTRKVVEYIERFVLPMIAETRSGGGTHTTVGKSRGMEFNEKWLNKGFKIMGLDLEAYHSIYSMNYPEMDTIVVVDNALMGSKA